MAYLAELGLIIAVSYCFGKAIGYYMLGNPTGRGLWLILVTTGALYKACIRGAWACENYWMYLAKRKLIDYTSEGGLHGNRVRVGKEKETAS